MTLSLSSFKGLGLSDSTWIGARDVLGNNQGFAWTDGMTVFSSYNSWSNNEPSNPLEECTELKARVSGQWTWNDLYCNNLIESMCERPLTVRLINPNP